MIDILTFQDLQSVPDADRDRAEFVRENDFAERFTQNFFRHFAFGVITENGKINPVFDFEVANE